MSDPIPAPVDLAGFRQVMGRFVTGVTVLTTYAGGHEHAMTANAVTSVSLEPCLVLTCVEIEARFHQAILDAGVWGVSILPTTGRATATWLATRGRPLHGQLDRIAHHRGTATGVPLIDGSLGTLECRTTAVHPGGDHSIIVGEVVGVELPPVSPSALTYHRGAFGTFG